MRCFSATISGKNSSGLLSPGILFEGQILKVYLSGKITGDVDYRKQFEAVQNELRAYGYVVFNPAVLPDGFEYEDYMSLDLLILSRCDAIYLLRDWENSTGLSGKWKKLSA